MIERVHPVAGLRTIEIVTGEPTDLIVIMLHGYAMRPEDLSPFAKSLGVSARFYFPQGSHNAEPNGLAWFAIDQTARVDALAVAPMDLYRELPSDAAPARAQLVGLIREVKREHANARIVLAGFSQGGMLACDTLLREDVSVSALVLLSSCRISAAEWEPRLPRLTGLPTLIAHGRQDAELAFSAGEALRDAMLRANARVTWLPFDGTHEIPLVVWRAIKKFVASLPDRT